MSGIYIHFPFCKSKCIYCNFYSVAALQHKEAYLSALLKEVEMTTGYLPDKHVVTVYFGGGTPSLLDVSEVETILNALSRHYDFSADAEITLEANPEQLKKQYVKDLKALGINRLSVGVQSFSDDILQLLKRRHTAVDAEQALHTVFEAGFDNVSIDLIYGIPYRSDNQWNDELSKAFSFPITHLSAYSLTVEPSTLLDRKIKNKQFLPIDERKEEDNYKQLIDRAKLSGFEHYEISNFAKNGCFSRHNFAYWEGVPYLGLGPSAHSFDGQSRQWNPADIQQYVKNIATGCREEEKEELTAEMRFNEYVMLMLRTYKGIDIEHIKTQFGVQYANQVLQHFKQVPAVFYSQLEANRYVLTAEGMRFADKIAVDLLA
jgi:oxygen-independent coproporphyrinogen-3 oxidase